MIRPTLPDEKIAALGDALARSGIPHAFGGAIALLYWGEPRATVDIDVNVFLPETRASEVLDPLERLGVHVDREHTLPTVQREGQVRLDWEGTPVDLFFAYDAFHEACAERVERVPFLDQTLPVLSAEDLVVFKVLFDRRKDWADIEQVLLVQGADFDVRYARRWVELIAGSDDARLGRLDELLEEVRRS